MRQLWLVLAIALSGCVYSTETPHPPGFSSTLHRMQMERAAARVNTPQDREAIQASGASYGPETALSARNASSALHASPGP